LIVTGTRWILDRDFPHVTSNNSDIDILHADQIHHRPGCVGIADSIRLGRTLVTQNQDFRGAWGLPLEHPGIVVLEGHSTSGLEIMRNLSHLIFCLDHHERQPDLWNQRFVIRVDRAILRINLEGYEEELETWKTPRVLAYTA
jgi:hypothetical protein